MSDLPEKPHAVPQFEPTRWSLVLRARGGDEAQRRVALEALCSAYWYPLYAYLRRSGRGVEDAEDLAQEFFVRLMDGRLIGAADPARGKFRTLLLTALHGQDVNAWRAAGAEKRGGGERLVALDGAEEKWLADGSKEGEPDAAFVRAWAATVVDRASMTLKQEFDAAGKGAVFDELFPRVSGGAKEEGFRAIGERLGMTEGNTKMAFHRMRQRFVDALKAEIGETVGSREDLQGELRYLLSLFL